jgi:hypothetical protein
VNVPPGGEVGRAASDVILDLAEEGVSRRHALFDYRSEADGTVGFYVRDLGSTNGTFVDGERIKGPVRLTEGRAIRFGTSGEPWLVVDAGPPNPAVLCGGALTVSQDEVLSLPDEQDPECMVIRDGERWLRHSGGRVERVRDRDVIEVRGRPYMLLLPNPAAALHPTETSGSAHQPVRLVLRTSRDQLREATLLVGSASHDLGQHVHNRELLALAAARVADLQHGRAPQERGWRSTHQLARTLEIDRAVLNVWTCRLRQKLRDIGVELIQDEPGGPRGCRRRLACDVEIEES